MKQFSYDFNPDNISISYFFFLFVGFVTPGPSSTAAISCLVARQLCSEQKTCNQILEVIPKTCGLELGKKECLLNSIMMFIAINIK